MRYEQRVCDLCGRRSRLVLVNDHTQVGQPLRAQSMLARGWTILGELDRCPDCTWMDHRTPDEATS
jgi:hypothetical protein